MGLIKSSQVPASASPFSMRDIENQARSILLQARQQAGQLLAAAQAEGDQLKEAARAEGDAQGQREGLARGLEQGKKAGHQQALEEYRAEFQQGVAALTRAAGAIDAQRNELEATALQDVVRLAIAVAQRVTKRQGLIDPQALVANLEEAMKLVMQHSDLRIAIHPTQRKTLDAALPQLKLAWPGLKHVEIIDDAALSPGGCRIFTRQGQIDADLGVQLDRVVCDLLPGHGEEAT
ncbi:MAG: Flagellar assembly protein FliH [Phycisphaerales bacterium]|nr:Flagellar assembly protein FliH [Phycisphaerales bacterium]MDB5299858.1 Flagellar assembly protein FliH [Phycisphaerales bacterium]MDB5299887.1 Flagellar assembly protein FliH [Phycisphaerales bacterium]